MTDTPRMRIEIWSDVVCPFCCIGKRQLEAALAEWPQRDRVDVVWRSFQLAPDTRTDPSRNSLQHLAGKKGWTLEYTREAMAELAAGIGLSDTGVRAMLDSDQFAADVRRDIEEASRFGISAVPCFVFDRTFAVSGAQGSPVLLQALRQSLAE